jgi:hypothetical protein
MTNNELLHTIQQKYPKSHIKNNYIIIDEIDVDIEKTKYGYSLWFEYYRKKFNKIEDVLKEIGIK